MNKKKPGRKMKSLMQTILVFVLLAPINKLELGYEVNKHGYGSENVLLKISIR